MNSHRLSSGTPTRSWMQVALDSLRELFRRSGQSPVPVLAAAGAGTLGAAPPPDQLHRVFGRRKDEPISEDGDSHESEASLRTDVASQAPPIPSATAEPGEPVAESDLGQEPAPPTAAEAEPIVDELPAWNPGPFGASVFGSEEEGAPPWQGEEAADVSSDDFAPATELGGHAAESFGWLEASPSASPEEASTELESLESVVSESEPVDRALGAAAPEPVAEAVPQFTEEAAAGNGAAPAGELLPEVAADDDPDLETVDSFPEVVAVSEEAWSVTAPEPPASYASYAGTAEGGRESAGTSLIGGRAFPLPEGEVVFRNLRTGFTDPARLLRHLAGEGHTGVMQISSAGGSASYVVLVDGYVVAVAQDSQGRVVTSNRVSFPNFPHSQDLLNVVSYSREVARGLALMLHAPVHFSALSAMFVDLDGLNSYLNKRSASGGMVVQAPAGIGVALYDEGRLVGAYADSQPPTPDLDQLRGLVRDLDAEVDVRLGGPEHLEPVPLDTLLAGYPL